MPGEEPKKWLLTPEGWSLAEVLRATLREPPEYGSARESFLRLHAIQRNDLEYLQDLALAQILIDKDQGKKAFDSYKDARFPWEGKNEELKKKQVAEIMEKVSKQGPIAVTAQMPNKMRSKLKAGVQATPKVEADDFSWIQPLSRRGLLLPQVFLPRGGYLLPACRSFRYLSEL